MADRVPIAQAIADAEEAVLEWDTLPEMQRDSYSVHQAQDEMQAVTRLHVLRQFESGEIVTAERAALEAMAARPCINRDQACEVVRWRIEDGEDAVDDLCFPCGARHTLENPCKRNLM